ncbi:uncharacterized protein [Rutidosis leptorrhynchoides]|uniref:uncharacterized protein n=1 Tax=Rutidosis leptorrhynchoides TaxID=125765 RepID=UPI003A98EA95
MAMTKENPFVDWFPDTRKNGALCTVGRPGYSSSIGSRKNFPSKWDDAEKWVVNGHESPAHGVVKSHDFIEKHQKTISVFQGPKIASLDHHDGCSDKALNGSLASESIDVLLKDKFTNEVEPAFPKYNCLESMSEGLLLKKTMENTISKPKMEAIQEAKNRDMGTEMTPIGSSTNSRSPTPSKNLSPPRHNTPESRLLLMDNHSNLFDIGKAKIQPWTPFDANWSSREDEEEEISKSLRLFEMNNDCLEIISGPRPSAWEEKEMSQPCIRYQIQEAKIKAWVNLQKAKAEAQSRKLEVKIQKMRAKYEEKTMKKMMVVNRKAEELRAAAQLEHSETMAKSNKTMNHRPSVGLSGHHGSCGCLIGNR